MNHECGKELISRYRKSSLYLSDTHEHSKQPNNGQVTWAHILLVKLWYPNGHKHMKRWSISVISLHYSNISNHYNNVNQTSRLATVKQN